MMFAFSLVIVSLISGAIGWVLGIATVIFMEPEMLNGSVHPQ